MNWIKSHKLLTAGIAAGVIVLYYLYKNMQANAAAAAANSTAAYPAAPQVIYGGGGGGAGLVASGPGGSQGSLVQIGTDANGNPIWGQPGASPPTTAPVAPVASSTAVATIPGANPTPAVSAPAAENVSSAVVNSPAAGGGLSPASVFAASATAQAGDLAPSSWGPQPIGTNGMPMPYPQQQYNLPGSPSGWANAPGGSGVGYNYGSTPFIGGGGGFPSVPGHTPMVPMSSAPPASPFTPQVPMVTHTPLIGPTQGFPGGSLA